MYRLVAVGLIVGLVGGVALADPLFPEIADHDFSFLGSPATYSYNGTSGDTLVIPRNVPPGIGANEVFAYTSPVIPKGASIPVYDDDPNDGFGGDLYLDLVFTHSDGNFVNSDTGQEINVNLVGTGNNNDGAGYDLEIWGSLGQNGNVHGLLLAMEVEQAVLYGYSGQSSFVVEAIGQIKFSAIPALAQQIALFGSVPGAVTGSLFFDQIPNIVDPGADLSGEIQVAYSGEAGEMVPEPITLLIAALGGLGFLHRRRRR